MQTFVTTKMENDLQLKMTHKAKQKLNLTLKAKSPLWANDITNQYIYIKINE